MPSGSPFLNVFELGTEKSEHPVKWANKWGTGAVGVLLVGGGIAAFLVGLLSTFSNLNKGADFILEAACLPIILAAGALALGGWALFAAWNNWGSAAAVFDRGLAVARFEDVRQVPWDEITAVWQEITKHYTNGIYTGTTHKYTVRLTDDTKYKFDDKYKDVETLGKAIQTSVTNTLFPKYVAALKAGSRLEFGPLAVDMNKIYSGKKELPWTEVKSIKIQGGFISVKKDKGWFKWAGATVPQIPNFFIFYSLLKNFTTVE
jgi:Family of unknown function (DUF6585)